MLLTRPPSLDIGLLSALQGQVIIRLVGDSAEAAPLIIAVHL